MSQFVRPFREAFLTLVTAFVIVVTGQSALAQTPTIPYQKILLLVAGPSGDKIDPREKAVVGHLNGLRSSYDFPQLQMGTMHYDRPQEAALLTGPLGFSSAKGITVGIVALSDSGIPVRTLYKMEQVTQASLLAAQNDLLSRWSQTTGQPLPQDLRPAGSAGGPTNLPVANKPPVTNKPPVATNPTSPPRPPATTSPPATSLPTQPNGKPWPVPNITPSQVYSFEGIKAVVFQMDDRSSGMWATLMNAPLRSDGNDLAVREQTKALSDATQALRAATEDGVVFPMEQLAAVSRAGRAWEKTEPRYYLPVPMRNSVEPMLALLLQIEEIQVQGSKTPQPSPGLSPGNTP